VAGIKLCRCQRPYLRCRTDRNDGLTGIDWRGA